MKFNREQDIKKNLKMGKYQKLNKLLSIEHTIRGGQIACYMLAEDQAENFLEALSEGILRI
jgi:hypothetical protein